MAKTADIPVEARSRFESIGAIPLDVVAELFERSEISTAAQASFWEAAMQKDITWLSGRVQRIHTGRGTKQVYIDDGHGKVHIFNVPDELTDDQFEEMKRAQNHRLPVTIEYQTKDGKKTVNSVEVWERDESPKGELV
jgi:hypothetical protein